MNRIAALIAGYPKTVIGLILLATVYMAVGLGKLQTRNNQESELPENDPIVRTNERLKEAFGNKAMILIGLETQDIYAPATLEKIQAISRDLKTVPDVIPDEINSLATVKDIEGKDWGLETGAIMNDGPLAPEDIGNLKRKVQGNPILRGRLVSEDGSFTAISANVKPGYDQGKVYAGVQAILAKYQGPEKLYVTGDAINPQEIDVGIQKDVGLLLPIVLLLTMIGFFLAFRTARGVALPIGIILMSIVWTMGIMGHLNLAITVISSAVPMLMVATASCYGVHVLYRYYEDLKLGSKGEVAGISLTRVAYPVIITGLTSALGSITLLSFKVTSIREFGIITAIGALAAMFLSLTLMPAILALLKLPKQSPEEGKVGRFEARVMVAVARFSLKRKTLILAGTAIALVISAFGISRIKVGNDFVQYFPAGHNLRTTFAKFNEKLGGGRYLNIMIVGNGAGTIQEPALLRQIDGLQGYAKTLPGVGYTSSFADIIKRINRQMNGGDPAFETIPESREAIAQYLLLYSMSGSPADFSNIVDYDYQRAKIQVMLKTSEQADHIRIYEDLQAYAKTHFGDQASIEFGGDAMFWLAQIRYIVEGKVWNIITGVLTIWLLCAFIFRSPVGGLFAIVPLVVSTVFTFGVMGLVGIRLETGTAIITSVAVGIGVDFAIHYLLRLIEEYKLTGDLDASVEKTIMGTGKAIFYDVLATVMGFMVFTLSGFMPIRFFGWLVSLLLITVGFASLILFPSLFAVFKPKFLERRRKEHALALSEAASKGKARPKTDSVPAF